MFRRRLCEWRMPSIRVVGCVCAGATVMAVAGAAKETPLPEKLSSWEPSLTARLAGGFKDNVALSQSRPESSAFVRTSLDAVAVRLPIDGTQTTLLLLGEDTRYFSSETVDHEDFLFGQAELRRFWPNDWQAAVSFEGAYIDQVVDLTVTEGVDVSGADTNRIRLAVKGGTLVGRPSVRRELSANWWLLAESPATRQMFDGVPDDYWIIAPKMTLGRTYGNGSEVSVAYEFSRRHYDTDLARETDRSAITNETRVSLQHELQGAWKHHWDARKRFRSLTKLSYRMSWEREGDYYDYDRTQLSEQWRYRAGPWELSIEGRVAWYHFPNQEGSHVGSDRERIDTAVSVRVERGLGRYWRVFAEYEYARTSSSLNLEEYAANTALGGVAVEF